MSFRLARDSSKNPPRGTSDVVQAPSRAEQRDFKGTNPDAKKTSSGGTTVKFDPELNPMSALYQPTYHFSFYLDTDVESEQGGEDIFVIAETGLTGMNLQDVQIDGFVGPNIRTRNATSTTITMKIFEPMGALLPDLLFQAAVTMNINNYLKAPWFLRLKLHGYDEDGKPQVVGGGWTWKLLITDIASQVTESGSVHTVTAMPQAEAALNNQYCMLPSMVNASGVTVGEVLQNIIKSMNENIIKTYGASSPPLVEFVIQDEPYPFDSMVGVSRPFDHRIVSPIPQDSNQGSDTTYGTQTSHFGPGTDIPAVLDKLMARTDTGMMIARISREKPASGVPDVEQNVRSPVSLMHRVDTKVEYLAYDVVIGDYAKRITYVVKPYQSLRLLTSMGRARSFDREKTLNLRKAEHAIHHNLIKKRYDYLFTGLNTEVEKFDININFRWAVSVPVVQGWGDNTGTTARVNLSDQAQDHLQQLRQNRADLQAVQDELRGLQAPPSDPNAPPEEETTTARRQELLNKQKDLETRGDSLARQTGAERDALNREREQVLNPRRAARRGLGRITDGEDEVYSNAQNSEEFGGAGFSKNGQSLLPVTVIQDPDAPVSSVRTGTSTDNNPNKGVYGALLNQLYGSFDGNLMNVELEIRGDPYWLGPGSDGKLYSQPSSSTVPNYMNGEHYFVFRFKLPQGYGDATGSVSVGRDAIAPTGDEKPMLGSSNIFTGFYFAVQVTNHFREGRFTQTLQGVRVQGWNYENIIEGREVVVDDDTNYVDTPVAPDTDANIINRPRSDGFRVNEPKGTARNNPGNVRDGPFAKRQTGYVGSDGKTFARFDTMENGIRAQERLLAYNYVQTPTTVTAVIDRYLGRNAPGNYNSEASRRNYISFVTQKLGSSTVNPSDVPRLAAAMRQFENRSD